VALWRGVRAVIEVLGKRTCGLWFGLCFKLDCLTSNYCKRGIKEVRYVRQVGIYRGISKTKTARNMRPGLRVSKKAIFAPSLGTELAGGVPFASGSEEGGSYSLATYHI
jgi:hypothetical protein